MILGISILDDRVLFAALTGSETEPDFASYQFDGTAPVMSGTAGSLWAVLGDQALGRYIDAEKIAVVIPSTRSFLKRIDIKTRYIESNPDYLDWLASTLLPGEISSYRFEFIPQSESFDHISRELLLFALRADYINPLLNALEIDGDERPIMLVPEQLGLVKTLERSLTRGDIPQAGIVNCASHGLTAVYVQHNRFNHSFYLPSNGKSADLATDLETYFLSRAETTESLPLVITGNPGDFLTNWTPIVPAFLGIHNLEYAAAWGAAEYIASK